MRGFALIEILIVIAILGLLLSLSVAVGIRFLKTAYLGSAVDEVNTILRKARDQSMSQDKDSAFGIYFASTQYILFKGNSFDSRDAFFDEVYSLPSGITASGMSEVVFEKFTGIPSSSGNIILTNNSETRTISINSIGRIAVVSCNGTPVACSTFADQTSCQNQDGCGWNPAFCDGTCTPCSSFNGQRLACQRQQGCTWDSGPRTCTGTCASCSTFVSQITCQNQSGCSWDPALCSGIAASCGSFYNQTSCQAQQGCVWE